MLENLLPLARLPATLLTAETEVLCRGVQVGLDTPWESGWEAMSASCPQGLGHTGIAALRGGGGLLTPGPSPLASCILPEVRVLEVCPAGDWPSLFAKCTFPLRGSAWGHWWGQG